MVIGSSNQPLKLGRLSHSGVLATNWGRYQKLLEVSTINFDLLGADDQQRVLASFERFLNAQTGSLQIIISNRTQTIAGQNLSRRRFLLVASCFLSRPDLKVAKIELQAQIETIVAGLAQIGLTARVLDREQTRLVLSAWFEKNQASQVIEKSQEIIIGRRLCRTLAVSGWPATAHPGWLNSLINFSGNLDISYHLQPVDLELSQTRLNRKITELDSRQRQLQRRGRPADSQTADAFDSAVELRQQIQKGQQKLFLVALFVTVWAESKPKLDQITTQVKTILSGRLFATQNLRWQQLEGLATVWPQGHNCLGYWRNLNSACAALLFPFVGSELVATTGIDYGINPANNSPVLVDRFCLANANSIIFAQSGAGKSYLAKVEILRSLAAGIDCVVIDPENEYHQLAQATGGQVIRFQTSQQVRLNLLDRRLWATRGKLPQTAEIVELLDLLIGLETIKEQWLVDQLLHQLYEQKADPVWADLVVLAQAQTPDLSRRLEQFGASSLGQVLGQKTSLDLNRTLTVFALDDWPPQQRVALTLLLAAFVRSQAASRFQKRLLVIDEGWLLLENPIAGRLLAGLVRRARKSYLGVCFISQQADDFLNNPAGKVIASQAALKFLLRLDSTAIKTVARQFRLSGVEQDLLLTAPRGQALILAESKHATVQIQATKSEHQLITTDPSEKLAQAKIGASNISGD